MIESLAIPPPLTDGRFPAIFVPVRSGHPTSD